MASLLHHHHHHHHHLGIRNTSIPLPSKILLPLLLLNLFQTTTTTVIAIPIVTTALPPYHPSKLQQFLHSKCHSPLTTTTTTTTPTTPPSSIWAYEGRLIDPTTDRTIARVEGIEIVRLVSEVHPIVDRTNPRDVFKTLRGLRRLGDLGIRSLLTKESGSGGWDYAGTVLSRKLFCYRDCARDASPSSSSSSRNEQSNLLTEYRIHPTSPRRKLQTKESIVAYDTATTYVSRLGGEEMVMVTEWPDGRWIQSVVGSGGMKMRMDEAGDDMNKDDGDVEGTGRKRTKGRKQEQPPPPASFEFTSFAKQSPIHQKLSFPKPLIKPPTTSNNGKKVNNDGLVISPPRSKLIQFGKDDDAERRRYGARETYSYTIGPPSPSPTTASTSVKRWQASNPLPNMNRAMRNVAFTIGERFRYYPLGEPPLPPPSSKSFYQSETEPTNGYSKSCSVRYTRYGEAPPWYGPGRMCTLELWGKRIHSIEDAPPVVKELVVGEETRVPGFWSVLPSSSSSGSAGLGSKSKEEKGGRRRQRGGGTTSLVNEMQREADLVAIQAVDSFRQRKGPPLIVTDLVEEEGGEGDYSSRRRSIQRGLNKWLRVDGDGGGVGNAALRLRKATTFISAGEVLDY